MKETAPYKCPKCGEQKLWRAISNPATSGRKLLMSMLFGIFAVSARGTVVYRCDACGYQDKYLERKRKRGSE
ncbi:MAG: hypothetical protein IKH57_11100 [Clostridia bacterium]|nr:hypothetical protein [Clostridia bacterium]